MLEWRRIKAVRRLTWVAIGFAIFPGAFFFVLSLALVGWHPEALLGLYPAALVGVIAMVLRYVRPSSEPVMEDWRPERELITPLPRHVEPRWWTPRRTLPLLLWIFPVFYLALVLSGARPFDWRMVGVLSGPGLLASVHVLYKLGGFERQLLERGVIARGLIRRIVSSQGFFRMKVEYEFDGQEFFTWTDNLSPKTWFGALYAEERRFVTLLVDPDEPERFVVYPFCGLTVPGPEPAWRVTSS